MERIQPQRIQLRRTKGWKMPLNTVKVDRSTIWGNPFVADDPQVAVDAFRRYIKGGTQTFEMGGPQGLRFASNTHPNALHWAYPEFVEKHIHLLRGKNLGCWCGLDKPCHGDVLLELANA